jgi:hypothetical protein
MALTINRKTEPFTVNFRGASLTVCRLTPPGRAALLAAHTTAGVLNEPAYMRAYYQACVTRWEHIAWEDGASVQFEPMILAAMPGPDQKELIDLIEAGPPGPLAERSGTS